MAGITGGFFIPKTVYAADEYLILNQIYTNGKETDITAENGALSGAFPYPDKYSVFRYSVNGSYDGNTSYKVTFNEPLYFGCSAWSIVSHISITDLNGNTLLTIFPDQMKYYKDYPAGTLRSYEIDTLNISATSDNQIGIRIGYYFTTNITSEQFNVASYDYISVSTDSKTDSLLNSIIDYIKEIFNSLSELPNKIQSFFTDLKGNLSSWFDDVGEWFTELKDNISAWFSDVGNWFVELGDKIKGFFSELSDNISGFFEKLWNKIWWGNENGESEYEPPTFSSGLTEILDKIDEYISSLEDTQTEIDNAKNNIVGYVEQGTSVINSVFGVFPTALTALVLFAIAFLFARKVVGR